MTKLKLTQDKFQLSTAKEDQDPLVIIGLNFTKICIIRYIISPTARQIERVMCEAWAPVRWLSS